ncbi:MAG: hypothetical protein M1840_000775 [Geoglossum simile]|nr:MAG: hypothetical protein M1840_000775 [Geoglossum simile]
MEAQSLLEKVHSLSDLELAALLCLVANQHCIIKTEEETTEALVQELQLAASKIFGLSHAVLTCSQSTTLDDFGDAILIEEPNPAYTTARPSSRGTQEWFCSDEASKGHGSYFSSRPPGPRLQSSPRAQAEEFADNRKIGNIIIAKDLNLACAQVQIQALELMRKKRFFTRTAVHVAPKRFLLIALLSDGALDSTLVTHLSDHFFISHHHSSSDGFPNLDEANGIASDDDGSISSVVRRTPVEEPGEQHRESLISMQDIDHIASLSEEVAYSTEVKSYVQHIVTFLRLHRAVAGGVSAQATRHFDTLVQCLAPLHSLTYVTPSLVGLAARKVYPHRILVATPETERSMQWGSDYNAVAAMLEGITPDEIVDEVLSMVEVPL